MTHISKYYISIIFLFLGAALAPRAQAGDFPFPIDLCDGVFIDCNPEFEFLGGDAAFDCPEELPPAETNIMVVFDGVPETCTNLTMTVEELISSDTEIFNDFGDCILLVTRIYRLTDGVNTARCDQVWEVRGPLSDRPGIEPGIEAPGDLVLTCDQQDPFVLVDGVVTNLDSGEPTILFGCESNNVSFSDVLTGSCSSSTVERTWMVESACGTIDSDVQTIQLIGTPATILLPFTSTNLPCGASMAPGDLGMATATNGCAPVLTHIDTTSESSACSETIRRVWRAESCLFITTATQTITRAICDLTQLECRPEFEDGPADEFPAPTDLISCTDDIPVYTDPTQVLEGLSPECSAGLSLTTRLSRVNDVGCDWVQVIEVTITDGQSTITCHQALEVQLFLEDAPTIVAPPNVNLPCTDAPDLLAQFTPESEGSAQGILNFDGGQPTITGCSDLEFTFRDTLISECESELAFRRVWTLASPNCFDEALPFPSASQIISLIPTAPDILLPFISTNLPCNAATAPTILGEATLNTNGCEATLLHADTVATNDCATTITRIWTATSCSAATLATQTIIVANDSISPVISFDAAVTINCDEDPSLLPPATVSDNCDTAPTLASQDFELASPTCPAAREILRFWVATDECENQTTVTQVITVVDNTAPAAPPPSPVTLFCGEDPATIPAPTNVIDACSSFAASMIETQSVNGCTTVITRVYTYTDECANSSSITQIINLVDASELSLNGPPVVNASCASIDPAIIGGAPLPLDTCGELNLDFSDTIIRDDCRAGTVYERVWTLSDSCGAAQTFTQFVSVVDDQPPTFTPPQNRMISCGFDFSSDAMGQPTNLTDNCDTNPMITSSDEVVPGACEGTFTILRIWTATDACSNTSVATQTISFVDDTPPVLSDVENLTIDCDATFPNEPPTVIDRCSSAIVTFVDTRLDSPCAAAFTVIRVWSATDTCGNEGTSVTQTISVVDQSPPVFIVPGGTTITLGESTDPTNTGMPSNTMDTCSMTTNSYVDTIEPGGCAGVETITRVWTVSDECGNSSTATQLISITGLPAPSFNPPADLTIGCGDSTNPSLTGEPSDIITDCTSNVTFSSQDAIFPGSCEGSSIIERTWTVTDCCGTMASALQTIAVIDDTPPSFNVPADQTVRCSDDTTPLVLGFPVPTDTCDSDPEFGFTDAFTPTFCPNRGSIRRTWTATDACGNSTSAVQIITVIDDTPPEISLPDDLTLICGDTIPPASNLMATVSDACDPTPLLFSSDTFAQGECVGEVIITRVWTARDACFNEVMATQIIQLVDTTPPTFTVPEDAVIQCGEPVPTSLPTDLEDNCSGTPSFTVSTQTMPGQCPQEEVIIRVFVASDSCGNIATATQTITRVDTIAPLFEPPADIVLGCTDPLPPASALAPTDNCDPSPIVSVTVLNESSTCPGNSTITRLWTATDACGNTMMSTQTITRIDSQPPSFTAPADLAIDCDEEADTNPELPDLLDNCDPNPQISITSSSAPGSCPGSETITRVWTVSDACGNIAVHTQQIARSDLTPPSFTAPANMTIGCRDDLSALESPSDLSDNCDPNPILSMSQTATPGACPGSETIFRLWTATDNCGNVTTQQQVITRLDLTPPTFDPISNLTISCDDPITATEPTANDECGDVSISMLDDTTTTCPGGQVITLTWIATDPCGNSSTATQTITRIDTEAPTFTPPENIILTCPADTDPEFTGGPTNLADNCSMPSASFVDTLGGDDCNRIISRVWTVTDECDNSSIATQTIEIVSPAPTISCPDSVTVDLGADTSPDALGRPTTESACGVVSLLFEDVQDVAIASAVEGCDSFVIERTWTAIDSCNATVSCIQFINVNDTAPPILDCPPFQIINDGSDCNGTVPDFSTLNTESGISVTQDIAPGTVVLEGLSAFVTITATDGCGNSTSCVTEVIALCDPAPEISIEKSLVSQNELSNGDIAVEYSILVQNVGNVNLTDLFVRDDLSNFPLPIYNLIVTTDAPEPDALFPNPQWSGIATQNLIAAQQFNLPWQTSQLSVSFIVEAPPPGTDVSFINTASITGQDADGTMVSASADAEPLVIQTEPPPPPPSNSADLSLTKTVDNNTPLVGDTITYTLTLSNDGPTDAGTIFVFDRLPNEVTYLSNSGPGSYSPSTGEWVLPSLAAGSSVSLEMEATVDVPGDIFNSAEILSSTLPDPDSTPGNGNPEEDDFAGVVLTATQPTFRLMGTVWEDVNRDGNPGNENLDDLGLGGITVILDELDADGNRVGSQTTVTESDGTYMFTGLLKGRYRVSIDPDSLPEELTTSTTPSSQAFELEGDSDGNFNFGFNETPTAIGLASFTATLTPNGVLIEWATAWEQDTLAFRIERNGGAVSDLILAGQGTYATVHEGSTGGLYTLVELTTDLSETETAVTLTTREANPLENAKTDLGTIGELTPTPGNNLLIPGANRIIDRSGEQAVQLIPQQLETKNGTAAYFNPGSATHLLVE